METNDIVVKNLPSTGIKVISNSKSGKLYLAADNILKETEALFYINWNGTPLNTSREKQPCDIIEIEASNLSEVYRADDDPDDWGQSFSIILNEYSLDDKGEVTKTELIEADANVAFYPFEDSEFYNLGKGVNKLVEEWIMQD